MKVKDTDVRIRKRKKNGNKVIVATTTKTMEKRRWNIVWARHSKVRGQIYVMPLILHSMC